LGFDHGVDDGLGVNNNIDVIVGRPKEIMRFNDLFKNKKVRTILVTFADSKMNAQRYA